MEEMENVAKLLKQNADAVESQSLEALNNIYVEKRRARKQYQDEYNRITSQFAQVSRFFIAVDKELEHNIC